MRKRALRTFLAASMVAGTSVLISASPAQAVSSAKLGSPFLNRAVIAANVIYTNGGERLQNMAASFNAITSSYGSSDENEGPGAMQVPGGSATLTVRHDFDDDEGLTGCRANQGNPTNIRVEIRTLNGSQVGTTDANFGILPGSGASCYGAQTMTVYFDNNPLDGDNLDGALTPGQYEIFIQAEGDTNGGSTANLTGASSRGDAAANPVSQYHAIGFFHIGGHMAGFYQEGNDHKELF